MPSKGRILVLKIMFYSEEKQISGLALRHQPRERDHQEKKIPIQTPQQGQHVNLGLFLDSCSHLSYQSMEDPASSIRYHQGLQKHSLTFDGNPLEASKMSSEVSVPQFLHSSVLCPSLQLHQDKENVLL